MKRIIIMAMLIAFSMSANAISYDTSYRSGRNYDKAMFRMWHADTARQLKAWLVLMPGSNSDGRPEVDDPQWQAFAAKNQLALVGCYFTDKPHEFMMAEEYMYVPAGSGDTLLKALRQLAVKSGHPALANAPMLLWGMSAGGQFNYEMACWKPNRIIGFVVNKGGFYYTAMSPVATRNVPALFFTGEKDMEYRTTVVKGVYALNRRIGACWAWAQETGIGHDVGRSKEMALQWFDAILRTRFANGQLQPINQQQGYIGLQPSLNIEPAESWKKTDQFISSWLPNKALADLWQSVQQPSK